MNKNLENMQSLLESIEHLYKTNLIFAGSFTSSWVIPKNYSFIKFINTNMLKLFLTSWK